MAKSGTFGDWKEAKKILKNLNKNVETNLRLATQRNGIMIRDRIKLFIRNQPSEWPALDPKTIAKKGSSKMLIDQGDLLAAVNFLMVDNKTIFVGWNRTEKTKDGDSLVNIAAVHTFGAEIQMTSSLGKRYTVVIPQRDAIGPVFERSKDEIEANWVSALNLALKGKRFSGKSFR